MPTRKPSMGRQRVEMTNILNKIQLHVTFSKRCARLFKKASDLCTLCGIEIAILVFSPAGKAFSSGHLSVDSVVNKFMNKAGLKASTPRRALSPVESHLANANVSELNQQTEWLLQWQESERKTAEMLDELRLAGQNQFWWEAPVDKLKLHDKKNVVVAATHMELFTSNHPRRSTVSICTEVAPEGTSSPEVSDDY